MYYEPKAIMLFQIYTILLTKITAAQNEVALSYHRVRGLYFLAAIFAATIVHSKTDVKSTLSGIMGVGAILCGVLVITKIDTRVYPRCLYCYTFTRSLHIILENWVIKTDFGGFGCLTFGTLEDEVYGFF